MAALAEKLTLPEFQSRYGRSERSYEYWCGEAVPKAMPTWIHGYLQFVLAQLLAEAGYLPGLEVELRIASDAHPRPDVIATSGDVEDPYPTKSVDVVVEILSPDDAMPYVLKKCQAYERWGFEYIYIVDVESRQLFRWSGTALTITLSLTTVPVEKIWERLEILLRRRR